MSANPNNPEDDAVASSSDTRGLLSRGNTARSSIEVGSDNEGDGGEGAGGVHPFQATPGYRDVIHWHTNRPKKSRLGKF